MKTSTNLREQVAANRTLFFQHRGDLQIDLQALVSMHVAARYNSDSPLYDYTPAQFIAAYVGDVGYPAAVEVVGSLVNVYSYDERISRRVADWAKGLDCAWDGESSLRLGLTSDRIHMCHLNQLAEALMNYELDVDDVDEPCLKKASYVVSRMVRKYGVHRDWLWDVLKSEFGILKGYGCFMSADDIFRFEEIINVTRPPYEVRVADVADVAEVAVEPVDVAGEVTAEIVEDAVEAEEVEGTETRERNQRERQPPSYREEQIQKTCRTRCGLFQTDNGGRRV